MKTSFILRNAIVTFSDLNRVIPFMIDVCAQVNVTINLLQGSSIYCFVLSLFISSPNCRKRNKAVYEDNSIVGITYVVQPFPIQYSSSHILQRLLEDIFRV